MFAAAQQAVKLAPEYAEGHSALGFALAFGSMDLRKAGAPYETSLKLGANAIIGQVQYVMGDINAAEGSYTAEKNSLFGLANGRRSGRGQSHGLGAGQGGSGHGASVSAQARAAPRHRRVIKVETRCLDKGCLGK